MSRRPSLQDRVDDYLAERRRQGFHLRSRDTFLSGFARFVAAKRHRGPLTAELMAEWVRAGKDGHGDAGTWARSWGRLRHFICYLQQFEPDTEVPEASLFGPAALHHTSIVKTKSSIYSRRRAHSAPPAAFVRSPSKPCSA
jgi:hypothetical protein